MKYQRHDARRVVFEQRGLQVVCRWVDAVAEIHRQLPSQIVAPVVPSRHIEVIAAESSGTGACKQQDVLVERQARRRFVERGVDVF